MRRCSLQSRVSRSTRSQAATCRQRRRLPQMTSQPVSSGTAPRQGVLGVGEWCASARTIARAASRPAGHEDGGSTGGDRGRSPRFSRETRTGSPSRTIKRRSTRMRLSTRVLITSGAAHLLPDGDLSSSAAVEGPVRAAVGTSRPCSSTICITRPAPLGPVRTPARQPQRHDAAEISTAPSLRSGYLPDAHQSRADESALE